MLLERIFCVFLGRVVVFPRKECFVVRIRRVFVWFLWLGSWYVFLMRVLADCQGEWRLQFGSWQRVFLYQVHGPVRHCGYARPCVCVCMCAYTRQCVCVCRVFLIEVHVSLRHYWNTHSRVWVRTYVRVDTLALRCACTCVFVCECVCVY